MRGDTDRAGIEVTLAHHDATFHHQRCGGETKFIRAQQCADHHIAPRFDLAVDLHRDAAAQAIQHQRLLRFSEPQLPRCARVFDGRDRGRASTAVVPRDGDVIGFRLGHAGGHCADADFGNQFHRNGRTRIAVFQIVNQLRQIFDRINIVMRRRRYQFNAGCREPQFANVVRDLMAR